MIKSIIISNWRSHHKTEVDLSDGTNLLVGIMGAGKTSVLEALCYGLYGNFPALQKKKVKLSQIASRFSPDEPTEVTVIFEKNEKKYSIKRRIEKGKSNAELREEERMIETKPEAVTNLIEKIIQVDYNTFIRAIYTEQNSLDSFLNMNPLERKKNVDELMGIDKFELARSKNTKLINIINRNLSEKLRDIENLNKVKKVSEKEECVKEIEKNNEIIKINEIKIKELRLENEDNEKRIKEESLKKNEYDKINLELIKEKVFVEQNEKELKNFKEEELIRFNQILEEIKVKNKTNKEKLERDEKSFGNILSEEGMYKNKINLIEKSENEIKNIESEIKEIGEVESYEKLKEKNDKFNEQIKVIEKEIWESEVQVNKSKEEVENVNKSKEKLNEIEKEMVELKGIVRREIEEKKSELENAIEWLATIKGIIKTSNESIEMLKDEKIGGRCPVCENELSEEKKKIMISDKEEVIKNSDKELEDAQEKIERLRKEIKYGEEGLIKRESYQKEKEILNETIKKSQITEETIKQIQKILDELKVKGNELKQEKKKIESEVDKAIKVKELENKNNELKDVVKDKGEIENKLKENEKRKSELESEIKRVKNEISESEMEIYSKQNEIEKIKKDLDLQKVIIEKKNKISEMEDTIKLINYDEKELEILNGKYNEIKIKLSEIETEKRMSESNLNVLEKNLKLIEEDIMKIEKSENEIRMLSENIESLKIYQNSLVETQISLRNSLITSINLVLDKVWKVLYPYGDYEKIKVEITENDYVLTALHGSEWVAIEGSVSGGERASMILALKVAFSVVLAPHLSMLILDEPTHNLDNNSVKALCEILREKLPKIIKQVVVITHDENLRDGANGELYLFSRNKDEYEPTKIEKISNGFILN